ncbi:MAG: sigma factor-like helix-turn-helix DNA-binding protein [Candidatus Omnitrophota bacterium]
MIRKNRNFDVDPYWFLEAAVHQEGSNIFNLAYHLCQDREEAEELTRAAFLKTLKNYRRFENSFQIYIFLCHATFDVWKNRSRRRTRYPARPFRHSVPTGSEAVAANQLITLNEIGKKEQFQLIQKGLAGLAPPDNFIIVLKDTEGKSYLEIACILKCRYLAVKSRLAQARKQLYANILSDLKNPINIAQDYHENSEFFSARLDNLLLPSVEENLQKHLKDCAECRKIFQEMKTVQKILAETDPVKPPDNFEAGILKAAKKMVARKTGPRYRLRHISYGLGSAVLILILFIVFYPKPTLQNRLVAPPGAPKNRTASTRQSTISGKTLSFLEAEFSRRTPPPHTIIRNEKEWANIWRLQNAGRNITAFLPEVDFNSKMVVVIISQDDKLEYTITKAEENKDEMIIVCEETSLTRKNPPLPLYQFQVVTAKPTVIFKMIRKQ